MTILFSNVLGSQNLSVHQWENRIILISADKSHSEMANQQLIVLEKEKVNLIDRKIVIYKCIVDSCEYYNWNTTVKRFQIHKAKKGFNTTLIGLDGGKKYESKSLEAPSVFFNLIDKMPMRRQELRNKDND
ncbi:MAG: DUF4174 domain-containing protein [Jejuia sp.]